MECLLLFSPTVKAADWFVSLALRLGLAYVFVTFGCEKVADWRGWTPMLSGPWTQWIVAWTGVPLATFLRMLGYGEIVLGLHLALGFCTRTASALAVALLATVVVVMGRTGIGVRDVGLLAAAIALVCAGGGAFALDAFTSERAP